MELFLYLQNRTKGLRLLNTGNVIVRIKFNLISLKSQLSLRLQRVGVGSEYTERLSLEEQHLYGSSKCGILKNQLAPITERAFNASLVPMGLHGNTIQTENRFSVSTEQNPIDLVQSIGGVNYREYGNKSYQCSNHLGNVLAVVSDIPVIASGAKQSLVLAATDYYPFGMQMPDRTHMSPNYRYGFGGHEKDDEVAGSGNHLSFGDYGYDSRLGRRWNVDPQANQMADVSPYATYFNNPIFYVDPDGEHPRRGNQISSIDFTRSFVLSTSGETTRFGNTDKALYKVVHAWALETTKVTPTGQNTPKLPSQAPKALKESKKLLSASLKWASQRFAEPHVNSNDWLLASKATKGYTYVTFSQDGKSGAVSQVENLGEGLENMVTFEYGFIKDGDDYKMVTVR